MSRPLLVVFALLLVLRAWVGDAMAMQPPTAGHCQPAHAAVQVPEGHAPHDGMAPHGAMHAAAPAVAHGGTAHCGDADAGHAACGDCQVCHTAALPFGPGGPVPAAVPQAVPRATPVAYASADPAPGFKPPILRSPRP
ncbi:hypothetical protein ACFX58_09145 [Sphingomonas sp. NCPPB 2930]